MPAVSAACPGTQITNYICNIASQAHYSLLMIMTIAAQPRHQEFRKHDEEYFSTDIRTPKGPGCVSLQFIDLCRTKVLSQNYKNRNSS